MSMVASWVSPHAATSSAWNQPVIASVSATNEHGSNARSQQVPVDDTILLNQLWVPASDGSLRPLSSPLRLHAVQADGEYVVTDNVFLMFGHGDSLEAALEDYGATILDYHEMIVEREGQGTIGDNERVDLDRLDTLFRTQGATAYAR